MMRPGWKPLFSLLFFIFELWLVLSLGKKSCEDIQTKRNCVVWKDRGHCGNETYRPYMELYCNETCGVCDSSIRTCPQGYFSCLGGIPQCVPTNKMCDCRVDCQTGHDETDCEWMMNACDDVTEPVVSFNQTGPTDPPVLLTPQPKVRLNGSNGTFEIEVVIEETTELPPFPGQASNGIECPALHTACTANKKCISENKWCDGWIKDCPDGEDETDLCYKPVNRDAFKTSSQNARVTVRNFFVTIQRMKHTHCPERAFSCKGACFDVVDLSSHRCACDPLCWMRNDCCIDVAEECPKHVRPQGVIEQCSPNLFGKDEELSALVVEQCPDSATVFDSARCKDTDEHEGMKYFGAPVYSPDTDKHYRNFFCAKCNGVNTEDLIPWNIWFGCQSTEVDFQEDCDSLIYIPPLNHPPETCRVKKFKDPSFDETIITTKQLEGLTVDRCQTVYAPVKYNDTLYRNPYCLYLHRYQVNDKNMSRLYTCDIDEEIPSCGDETSPCRPSFSCMSNDVVCDGKQDCEDRSDEPATCLDSGPCYPMFQCKSTRHQCFSRTKLCDSFQDCADGSDEENCTQETLTPRYIQNFHESLSQLSEYPRISNSYEAKEDSNSHSITSTSAITKKIPKCIKPLIFDGYNCRYTGNITANKKYDEVYMKQLVQTYSYNITLSPLGFHRPQAMGNDPVEFLAKHLKHYPYQVIDFSMGEKVGKTVKAQMTTRALTKLEKRNMKGYNRSKKYEENYIQIGTEIYLVKAVQTGIKFSGEVLDTKIDCQFDSSGPIVQVMCTGCAYVEYSSYEYNITSAGHIQLKESGQILKYYEYELRDEGSILICWETSNSNKTVDKTNDREAPMKIWFGVGYSLAFLVHFIAFIMQLFYGRKTTLRIFFINFTTMGVIWSFDALLCTVSASYSSSAQSLHLFGSLGTLAWLLIISFHLLLSVSDGSPAVYFSVDNLLFYHICGWLCPLGWVFLFFFLSTFEVVEDVTCLTDPRQNLIMNPSSEILHFPVWIMLVVIFLLLMIVIVTTKRLMSGKSGKVDLEVLGRRLEIKIMVFLLFMLQALPWVVSLCLKYFARGFKYHNAVFCLCCVVEGSYLIYILKALVDGNLERLRHMTPTPDSLHKIAASPNSELSLTPDMKPALPPKINRGPRPPLYQRPVDHNYTPFPDRQRSSSHPQQDQYSHLQGGHLGGNRNGKKKEYYPMTHLANPTYGGSMKGSNAAQDHQYMPLVRGADKARSPSRSPCSPRSRRRSKSGQGGNTVSSEPGYQPVTPVSDKGKHKVARSSHHSDQSYPPSTFQLADYQQNDNPPPYRASEGFSPEIFPCSSSEGLFRSGPDSLQDQRHNFNQNAVPINWDSSSPSAGVDPFKSSYC